MTFQNAPLPSAASTSCLALLCAGLLCAAEAGASPKKARAPHAASAPTTEQILAPSRATPPDALPPERAVYRCGSSYSSRPCAASQRPMDVADARSDAQRRQSEELTSRDKRLAAWLEADRHRREAPASAPPRARPAAPGKACVETTAAACHPKQPRPQHAAARTASGTPGH